MARRSIHCCRLESSRIRVLRKLDQGRRYFVFRSAHNGSNNIWALDEGGLLGGLLPVKPFQVTNGPLSYRSPVTSRTGHGIFSLGLNTRSELLRYDPH